MAELLTSFAETSQLHLAIRDWKSRIYLMILRNHGLKRSMKMMHRIQSWWLHCRCDFMGGVESLSRVIEKMRFSARSKQSRVTDYFSREPASEGAPEYRRSDFVNFPWIVNIVVLPEWFTKYEDLLY